MKMALAFVLTFGLLGVLFGGGRAALNIHTQHALVAID